MKELLILVVLFFPDPHYTGEDSVLIRTFNGIPLVFNTEKDCHAWIWKDLEGLKRHALSVYPNAVSVKEILCVDETKKLKRKAMK